MNERAERGYRMCLARERNLERRLIKFAQKIRNEYFIDNLIEIIVSGSISDLKWYLHQTDYEFARNIKKDLLDVAEQKIYWFSKKHSLSP
jgi:hypothetical protein